MQLIIFAALAQLALGSPIDATGTTESPGAISGNVVQVPAHVPVNVSGNSVNVVGLLNPAFGNTSTNETIMLITISLAI
ncbi:DUF320-domain-containing protein [Conidiobolus coronatus NRRL 28638]|uniref:DUF320-domain-containing protein n=1 Tax=Conidiobolus coronatus (strain ATCC 28846 / CBS 209.66 / NRRL 28638) TaxID=796925 RepID=A0A137NX54_CONC2|nr:DUF320-domain-containing protein [Conidiobolus coronatus NRRL 28638]|eukprot:KXN67278.1 DUF320-domain-containing protein [Conidiobolus coronatus NRRL 28638]